MPLKLCSRQYFQDKKYWQENGLERSSEASRLVHGDHFTILDCIIECRTLPLFSIIIYISYFFQLEAVKDHGTQLMQAKHFEAPKVEQTLGALIDR